MTSTSTVQPTDVLSEQELDALLDSAVWYAKYHAHIINEQADDRSSAALAQRDRYLELHRALGKLGVRLRLPARLEPA